MSKNLVLTITTGKFHQALGKITIPTISSYAKKIGAEFRCLTEVSVATTSFFYDKFVIGNLLENFDRILFLDADVLVRQDCPSLFDLVPAEELGMFNEGLLTTDKERDWHADCMKRAFQEYGVPFSDAWDGRFYNTGVMVVPKSMKSLFTKPEHEMLDNYREQAYLTMVLLTTGSINNVFDIGYKFNRMYYVDPKVKESRFKSYIMHYAGLRTSEILHDIKRDLFVWKHNDKEMVKKAKDWFPKY